MANEYTSKVVLSTGEVLIDLTGDTITAADIINSKKAHDKSGAQITGTCSYDADTSDGTADAAEILSSKTAYVNGSKVVGSMPNRGAVAGTISAKEDEYVIQQGFHDGSGKVSIASTEKAKIVPVNIKSGVTLLGIQGSYTGESVTAQTKNATPTFTSQTILPDNDFDYLSQVTIAPIPVTRTDNSAGGVTVTIG